MKLTRTKLQNLLIEQTLFSEGLRYHVENSIPLYDCIYRPGSKGFFFANPLDARKALQMLEHLFFQYIFAYEKEQNQFGWITQTQDNNILFSRRDQKTYTKIL